MLNARNILARLPAALAALCLPAFPAIAAARAPIVPVPIAAGQTRIEVPYHDPDSKQAKAVFQCCVDGTTLPFHVNLLRRRGENRLTRLLGNVDLPIREAGVTTPRADLQDDVFYRAEADSGARRIREIGLVVPWSFTTIALRVVREGGGDRILERRPSANFDDPALAEERAFLLALEQEGMAKPGAGFVAGSAAAHGASAATVADPHPMPADTAAHAHAVLDVAALFRAWLAANDAIASGRMTIARVPGLPPAIGDVTDSLRIGDVAVTAHFRSGVLASDRGAAESWALFHPHDASAWPTVLASAGRWVVIGTHGEGLACVDPRTFDLRRVPLDPPDHQVVTLEARGDSILVNGRRRVALPTR